MNRYLKYGCCLLLFAGCQTMEDHFRSNSLGQASFDLNCPKEQLKVNEVAHGRVGVVGCGKRALYILDAQSGWIRNSEIIDETKN